MHSGNKSSAFHFCVSIKHRKAIIKEMLEMVLIRHSTAHYHLLQLSREIDVRPKGSNMILKMHLTPPFPLNIKLALLEEAACSKSVLSIAQFFGHTTEYLLLPVAGPSAAAQLQASVGNMPSG